ncbi:MAG: agmatinase [Erysipelotrichaceae bacterium]
MINNKVSFIGAEASYEEANIVIYGAPFDSTTSYRPGARFGSNAIRNESYGIETYSPYQDKDLLDLKIYDAGDIELCIGNSTKALASIQTIAEEIIAANKLPIMLGGEHLVSLAPIKAIVKAYPNVHIIHFDAHADLRDNYLEEQLSHACVIRRAHELVGDGHIHQFGIRSGEQSEFEFAKEHTNMHKFSLIEFKETISKFSNEPIYFTLDLDILDPSIFSGTGTPEAGGISYLELQEAILLLRNLNIVGADIVELAPNLDPTGVSSAVACKILRELLLTIGGINNEK